MPRRADYGDEIHDDRVYQDDMNIWKEQKLDHSTQEKEYKKQRREFNKKLKQIKNSLLSKCDLDVREYLENTHSPMVAAYLHPEVTQPQEPQRGDLPPPVVGNLRTS